MERIVLECKGRKGIVLEPDGTFRTVRLPRNASVGDALPAPFWAGQSLALLRDSVETLQRPAFRWKRALAAATAVLVLVSGAGAAVYAAPVSYLSLDMNIGVSLTLNRFDRVIGVRGDDALASAVLDEAGVLHMTYAQGVAAILAAAESHGVLGTGIQAVVAVASTEEGRDESIGAEIRDYLEAEFGDRGYEHEVESDNVAVQTVREARDLNITPGRLRLLRKLGKAMGDTYVQSDWIGRPISEIMKTLVSLGVDPDDEDDEDDAVDEGEDRDPEGDEEPDEDGKSLSAQEDDHRPPESTRSAGSGDSEDAGDSDGSEDSEDAGETD